MSAIRLARGFTGRDTIVKFEGCYHGHSDSLLIKAGSGALTLGVPTSPGVPAAELERIFEPFYRVAESRDRDSGGEGIGLAITSQVMKAHGGSAQAVNAPNGGLEVRLRLPGTAIAD